MKNSEKTKPIPSTKGDKREKKSQTNKPSRQENGKSQKQEQNKGENSFSRTEKDNSKGVNKNSDKKQNNGTTNNNSEDKKTTNQNLPWKDPDLTQHEETQKNDRTVPEKKKDIYNTPSNEYKQNIKTPGQQQNNQQQQQQKQASKNQQTEEEEGQEENEQDESTPEIFNPQGGKKEAFGGEKRNEQNITEFDQDKKGL